MSCWSNSQAMLYAANYDPEAIIDSNIQPMIFPLHVTYNGETFICGMEGMGDTTLANSLCNKFNWPNDNVRAREALDNSTSFLHFRGGKFNGGSWSSSHHRKRGDGERGTNITTRTISSKRYLILFHKAGSYDDLFNFAGSHRLIAGSRSYDSLNGRGDVRLLIERVDTSLL